MHMSWEQFCCCWMYTKTARNKSQLFKPVDQRRRQLEMRFYSRCCILRSGVIVLARKIRLAMTSGGTINYNL